MKYITSILLVCIISYSYNLSGQIEWPKEIPLESGGKIMIYQPQLEKMEGNDLYMRTAVSVRVNAGDEPIFGAVWGIANMLTDLDTRTATLETVEVTDVRFPGDPSEDDIDEFRILLEQEIPKWNIVASLDQIIATLEEYGAQQSEGLNTKPPKIIYKEEPSVLVLIDGDPKIEKDKDMNLDRVMNTPFLIVRNPDDNKFYLFGGDFWYSSNNVLNGWVPVDKLKGTIKDLDKAMQEQLEKNSTEEDKAKEKAESPPSIVISTEPAELITTDGEPDFQSIETTSILYVANTENDILMDINTQKYYVLFSGRWYVSKSMNGPWAYASSDDLPEGFKTIPEGSDKDQVLASIAGTKAAEEAVKDAQIPQTAKVDRNSTECNVTYDGKPKFEAIEGTNMEVAVNTSSTVLKSGSKYYAVDNGVWFVSNKPDGPWQVSTERPADVDNIPATSQAYNVKYVYIYDTTPDYVYVGYTPGYLGSYVYGPTVVYGTGWYYRPWYGSYYYPRHWTWGFNMSYNPWYGWSMGFTFSNGFFNFSYRGGGWGYPGGWWGPPAYRPPYRPPYRGSYYGPRYGNTNINIDRSTNINVNRDRINNNRQTNNLYNRRGDAVTRDRVSTADLSRDRVNRDQQPVTRDNLQNRPSTRDIDRRARPSTGAKNNVYTDRSGNVYRQKDNGKLQSRESGNWKNARRNTTPQQRSEIQRQSMMRSRGNTRTNNYRSAPSRSMPSRSMPSRSMPSRSARPAPSRGRGG
jgi:hypothetical protein